MSDKPRGFILQPSRLGRQAAETEDRAAVARPNFTGLKESKLGILAESKLTPSTGAIQAKPSNGAGEEEGVPVRPPPTFSFTPLTRPADDTNNTKHVEGETNNTNTAAKQDKEETETKRFVFGQNLTERAEIGAEGSADSNTNNSSVTTAASLVFGEDLARRGAGTDDSKQEVDSKPDSTTVSPQKEFSSTPSLLFGGIVTSAKGPEEDGTTKTLSESAAEYTESHNKKRKYDVVDVVTGEEEESNVLQANVKMYLFDTEKRNWTERGRGVIRLNDDPVSTPGHLKSRLVMRTVGSLRVVLNTKLWPNMVCEKANEKNVRISAMEENEVKIFLIACSPKDADKLFTALEYRISQLKADTEADTGPPPEKKVAKDAEA